FRGKLIIADSTERNVVIPSSAPPQLNCGDRGCVVSLIYSTDGGRTFHGTDYMRAFDPLQESRRYSIYVDRNSYFVEKMRQSDSVTNRFPLLPGFVYGQDTLPEDNKIQFDVKVPVGLHSPSGQERFSCNASIRPTNPDAPLK
ncbi:T6SS immunity protein Tli3 family protein, partial [Caballeronia glebae]